ncbi:hypothetical protein TSAR_013118 [Trichomalopsis sarcophagae]|uniref:Endonuclease/exonuclease/phosphatase domain-containing protein n=1 Tax=Trichomalopsis sarcophagae TaxID=543379 RepID=A0A232ERF5_9HYME|nr:hypothetical protein TSAR_013118 [Trichomalopsis sarcophagae]
MAQQTQFDILQWNCHSLKGKNYELEMLLNDFSVARLQETWLKGQEIMRLKGFNCIRKDRITDTNGGRLLTAIRDNLSYKTISMNREFNGFEILATKIKFQSSTYNVFNIYRDHRVIPEKSVTSKLINCIDQFKNVIICGDLNAHHEMWSTGKTEKLGKQLASELINSNLVVLNEPPQTTLIPKLGNRPGSPDISIISINLIHKTQWQVLEDGKGSDHLPVAIKIASLIDKRATNRTKLNTNKVNWTKFQSEVEYKVGNGDLNLTNPTEAYEKIPII